jgi:hypothetical protein
MWQRALVEPTTMWTRKSKNKDKVAGFTQENGDRNGDALGTGSAEKPSQGRKRGVSHEQESDEDECAPAEKQTKLSEECEKVGVIDNNGHVDRNTLLGAGQGKLVIVHTLSVSHMEGTYGFSISTLLVPSTIQSSPPLGRWAADSGRSR